MDSDVEVYVNCGMIIGHALYFDKAGISAIFGTIREMSDTGYGLNWLGYGKIGSHNKFDDLLYCKFDAASEK